MKTKTYKRKRDVQAETQSILDGIRRIVRSLREASKVAEKEIGLSAAQLFVLQKIADSDEPLCINDLARKPLTHQSSVSVVVSKLVKRKLVERVSSPLDARAAEVRLSRTGQALLRGSPPLIQERLVDGVSKLSPAERLGLVTGLKALIAKAGLQDQEASLFFEDEREG